MGNIASVSKKSKITENIASHSKIYPTHYESFTLNSTPDRKKVNDISKSNIQK
jgi:hypothetical protein